MLYSCVVSVSLLHLEEVVVVVNVAGGLNERDGEKK